MKTCWEEAGWEQLAPDVARCRLPDWDCTVGVVVGDTDVLVVDTGSSLREGAALRAEITRLTGRRPTRIALTHPHFDHVLGTAAFAGCAVYGATGLDALLRRDRDALREDAIRHGVAPDAAAEAVDHLVPPHHAVSGEVTLDLGGRSVLLANVGPGHTAHDLAVLVPGRVPGQPEVVFCGDLVEESGPPQAGPDAIPAHWPAALDRLIALGGEDARYVPGHGSVVDAAFVRDQRDELAARFGVSR
ncbi:metallo-beta-lactamase superfamily protein [Streptomyces himastatinicus ATCC 53653]|uniref:Metallo-beta-lactamase superfamily protein n=1 Tax=Streptomyces himastatinicus ATCC 53653 TaxID=457427 RepID=D9WRQ8_9ACTN|nr:MBL fold metallo-hydrolase [Streptomyces himastatinicus]EFL26178.1 metallo-beta-lactamase superfamily protein [Streptomyces himastatinicus ATCC 53653]